jgi:hypothetical protein
MVRADIRARQTATREGIDKVSQLPGVSPRGGAVLANLEHTRLWPCQAEQALRYWRAYLRDPYAWRWDRPDSCGNWHCFPDIVLHVSPQRVSQLLKIRTAGKASAASRAVGSQPTGGKATARRHIFK